MASVYDRRVSAYADATSLTQAMLDECFRGGECQLEAVGTLTKTVGGTTYTLRFADRPKFVGDNFYEGRAKFPTVKRTLGELQAPSIQFAQFEVNLANMDGFYNQYLEEGSNYISWVGARLQIQLGLRDVASSFVEVFDGFVPEEDGFNVNHDQITIRATDRFNALNSNPPLPSINLTDFPSAPQDSIGKIIPMVLGDWTVGYNYTVNASKESCADGATPTPGSQDCFADAPNGFYGGVTGYYVGGGYFVFSIGTYTPDNVSICHVKRGEKMLQVVFTATPFNTAGYWSVHVGGLIRTDTGATYPYVYQTGDVLLISVKVPYAVGKYDNLIEQTREILYTLGGMTSADLETSSWTTYISKASPATSAFTSIKSRIWIGDDKDTILGNALSLLEQCRMEMFINQGSKLQLSSLQPEDWAVPPSTAARIDQMEIDETKCEMKAADNMFFNQAYANYAFTPVTSKTSLSTAQFKNANSIAKAGKLVIKAIDYPNLYVEADATNQLKEMLRFYSAGMSFMEVDVSWSHMLRDLGQMVSFNYSIGSLAFVETPMMVRDFGINPATGAVSLRLLSFANFPYGSYSPANATRFLSSAGTITGGTDPGAITAA